MIPSEIVPGGKPVTANPGHTPTSPPALPLMTVVPVLVTVVPAKTAKVAVVPRLTGASAATTLTGEIIMIQIKSVKHIDIERKIIALISFKAFLSQGLFTFARR
jgi:hypothetical protein